MSGSSLRAEDRLLLAAVLLLPWAFGGVEPWAYRGASLLVVAATTLALWREGPGALGAGNVRWLLPAGLLAVWAGFQLAPLPPPVLATVSPHSHAIQQRVFPGYDEEAPADLREALEARALERVPEARAVPLPRRDTLPWNPELGGRWSGWRPISLLPAAGIERLHWYVALLLAFLLVRRRCLERSRARAYRAALLTLFVALALFGLLYTATSNGKLYWVRESLRLGRPFGPYLNPTHFAGVMELAGPWMAGHAWELRRRRDGSAALAPLWGAGALLCLVAALATASKAAGVLLGGSLLVLGLVACRSWLQRGVLLGAAAALAVAAPALLAPTVLGDRIQRFLDVTSGGLGEVSRLVAWRASLATVGDYLWTGTGFGAFAEVFRHYIPAGEAELWAQLHNDYLQLLVEGGVPAVALVAWLSWGAWRRILGGLVRRGGGVRLEQAGLALGLASLCVHAVFDFNHQIPGNALLFVALSALAVVRFERRAA